MPTFPGKRMRRPRVTLAAVLALIATPGVCALIALQVGVRTIPWVGLSRK